MQVNRMTGPDCAVMCNFINTRTHETRSPVDLRSATPRSAAPLLASSQEADRRATNSICRSPQGCCTGTPDDFLYFVFF